MANTVSNTQVAFLKDLLSSGDYSDLVVTCGSDTYNVHKAVVCSRSGFFKRAERFPGQEAAEGKIDLPDDEPAVIKLLIQYLYEGEYDPKLLPDTSTTSVPEVVGTRMTIFRYEFPHTCLLSCPTPGHMVCHHHQCFPRTCGDKCVNFVCKICCPNPPPGDSSQLLLHSKMYKIGDKYDISSLKELARDKFSRACAEHWNTKHFAPAAHHAFSTTPESDKGLRDIISKTLADHMALLNKPEVEAILNEFNGLAVGLLKMRAKDLGWVKPAP